MGKKPTFGIERPSATSAQELDAFVKGQDANNPKKPVSNNDAQTLQGRSRKKKSKARNTKTGPKSKSAVVRADGTEVRRLTVYLPPDLYLKCKVHTAAQDRSLSDWICELVETELESA